jgi:D-galacturonate reductase
MGVGVYTASWTAPPTDVHSQQHFFYLGHRGQVHIDQAHRCLRCVPSLAWHAF